MITIIVPEWVVYAVLGMASVSLLLRLISVTLEHKLIRARYRNAAVMAVLHKLQEKEEIEDAK